MSQAFSPSRILLAALCPLLASCSLGFFYPGGANPVTPNIQPVVSICSVLSGCTAGFLYSNTVRPLTLNLDETLIGSQSGSSGTQSVALPVGGVNISGEWSSRTFGAAALSGNLHVMHYADEHRISILGGLWSRRTVVVYGD